MSPTPRVTAKFLVDLLLWWSLTPLAFLLRLEERAWQYLPEIALLMLVGLPVKAAIVFGLGWHRRSWRRMGVHDLYSLVVGLLLVTVAYMSVGMAVPGDLMIPRSIPLLEGMLAVLALGGVRLAARLGSERFRASRAGDRRARRVLIVGAGEAGVMVARELLRHPETSRQPVGFLDDDRSKHRERFLGLRVLGPVDRLPQVVAEHRVEEVLIAMPSQSGEVVRRVVELAHQARVEHRTLPGLYDLVSGSLSVGDIREVDLEDLLRREPVTLETGRIADYLEHRLVLVTGAGGSIGSEIVRQVAAFGPAAILLVGRGENSIFEIDRELARSHPRLERHPLVADVRDRDTLAAIFEEYRPEVVFHAAAHKHVPLMEANPEQAVFNNVGGTRNLVELALEFGVSCFVNVSTDKAVNPTSMMGASKRVAEMVVHSASRCCEPGCSYVSVRFGNVLGSRGSVVPLFKEQIRRGGPVSVTHPDMERYFMTIPEATQLVLQAGSMGMNGAVCVLDMGQPVRISDLAHDLIMLCGKEPGVDVEIQYTGMRPGEKLFEELLLAEEGTLPSDHDKIFLARSVGDTSSSFDQRLAALFQAADRRDRPALRAAFSALVPTCAFDPPRAPEVMIPAGDGGTGRTVVAK